MSDFHHQSDRWLDAELRGVPLPEGLLARLREIAAGSDAEFDAALCDVKVPVGLVDRVKRAATEAEFELALANVAVPAGLTARLHAIPAYEDDELDAGLRDVRLPAALRANLLEVPRQGRRVLPWSWSGAAVRRFTLAASLVLLASLLQLGTLAWVLVPAHHRLALAEQNRLAAEAALDGVELEHESALDVEALLAFELPAITADEGPDPVLPAPIELELPDDPAPPSAIAQLQQQFHRWRKQGIDPFADMISTYAGMTAPASNDRLPEIERVESPKPRGIAPPLVKEADLVRWFRDGVFPFLKPGDHPDLESVAVPLVTSSASYESAWNWLRRRRLPPAGEIRPEEFLASIRYPFSAPEAGSLGLRAAAGPAPFGDAGASLLQIGVQAARTLAAPREPAHLVVALDISSDMLRSDRLNRARRAIGRLVESLGPQDRFTLITFGEYADVLVENAGRNDVATIRAALAGIAPRATANLGLGLHVAAAAAQRIAVAPDMTRRMVLVTGGTIEFPPSVAERLRFLAADLAERGLRLDVLEVAPAQSANRTLTQLAEAGRGQLRTADNSEAIRLALAEALTGQQQLAARQVRLTVRFNPAAVAEYRLLGHEATGVGGTLTGSLDADLYLDQAASALFELKLRGDADDVAWAELRWIDPAAGQSRQARQRISRLQFATSLVESPASLQQAALAAETAEVLRNSSYAPTSGGLARVLETAAQLPLSIREESSLAELLSLAEAAQRVQASRPAPRGLPPLFRRSER